jgi:UDP-N-acetyl-D-mannosaminuronic acid transferase (WecB/TagA/CpsF family)
MRQDRTIPISAKPFAHVDGQALNVATLTDAVRKAISRLEQGMGFTLFTLNLDHLHKRRSNPEFRERMAAPPSCWRTARPLWPWPAARARC